MRPLLPAALLAAVVLGASGCVHARWPAKTLADGVAVSQNVVNATIPQLRVLPRPPGVGFAASRLPQERQLYRLRVVLLRFSLASDGDIHLAIGDPHNHTATMIAEIPDPARMNGAPARYRDEVARARREFTAVFGAPSFGVWRAAGRQIEITGPVFFDLLTGEVGGQAAGAPSAVEIHPVLRIVALERRESV